MPMHLMMEEMEFRQILVIHSNKLNFLEEFLRENYSFLTRFVEIIAAITGILLLKKYKNSNTKYFIYFLIYVTILELIGSYPDYLAKYTFLSDIKVALEGTLFESNYWWFSIFWKIGSALFYSFYFIKILKTKLYIKMIKLSSILFFISSIIYIAINWSDFFISTLPFISIFGATIIILCVIFYFLEMLQSDTILTFYKSINFYISTTILIWWLVITPIVFYDVYFSTADWNFVILKWQIYLLMNIFMYSSFTIALIWCKPQNV